jgi:hypothetical protein
MTRPGLRIALVAIAVVYSIAHIITSGILFAVRTPNVGQVIEELQPLFRLFTTGEATVDHPRQYGPVFLFLFHPVYRITLDDPVRLAWYAYALDVLAILIGFAATWDGIRTWARARGVEASWGMLLGLFLLWANFSPLYGVLVIKNVELWELAALAVGGAALLRGRRGIAGWSVAAAALIKMLPLVFMPYLLLRDRRTFAHAVAALAVLLTLSQAIYGTAMGWGYLPAMINAASGGDSYGWSLGMTWHENVSLRGVAVKAFGFLTFPDFAIADPLNTRGFFVRTWPGMSGIARAVGFVLWAIGVLWVAWALLRRRARPEPGRTFWDWAIVGVMMLVLAPQISQDYMVLTLVAFSYVLAGCMIYGGTAAWVEFAIAVLLVANVLPRGVFSRLVLIDPIMAWSGYTHMTRAEAYQYFCFPLIGLLVLARLWIRLSDADDAAVERSLTEVSAAPHRI